MSDNLKEMGKPMTLLEAYFEQRRRAVLRMWVGFFMANVACIGAMTVLFLW